MNYTKTLTVEPLQSDLKVRIPDEDVMLSMDCSAMELLTDFAHSVPPMIESSTSVDEADHLMRREHCTYKIVIGSDEQFRGIVTLLDIHSSATMRATNKTGLSRNELAVTEVMVPRSDLHALRFSKFEKATVRDIVELLKSLGERFLLVIDDDTGSLRGLVSSRSVTRRLALPNMPFKPARTFAEIQSALSQH